MIALISNLKSLHNQCHLELDKKRQEFYKKYGKGHNPDHSPVEEHSAVQVFVALRNLEASLSREIYQLECYREK